MQTLQLEISGMMCEACQSHVTKALSMAPGVENALVDLENKSATVRGEDLDVATLIHAVEEEGYEARATTAAAN